MNTDIALELAVNEIKKLRRENAVLHEENTRSRGTIEILARQLAQRDRESAIWIIRSNIATQFVHTVANDDLTIAEIRAQAQEAWKSIAFWVVNGHVECPHCHARIEESS